MSRRESGTQSQNPGLILRTGRDSDCHPPPLPAAPWGFTPGPDFSLRARIAHSRFMSTRPKRRGHLRPFTSFFFSSAGPSLSNAEPDFCEQRGDADAEQHEQPIDLAPVLPLEVT